MKFHKVWMLMLVGALGAFGVEQAEAALGDYGDYTATSFGNGGGDHAVWFSKGMGVFGGNDKQRYHFTNPGGEFSYQDNKAVLDGTIYNSANPSQQFKFHFEYTEAVGNPLTLGQINPKLGGTNNNASWARNNWNFYNMDVANSGIYDLNTNQLVAQFRQLPTNLSKPFQVGFGANDKGQNIGDFGASGWFEFRVWNTNENQWSGWKQGDVNIDLNPKTPPPGPKIPAPGALALAMLGLPLVNWMRRRVS